MKKLIGLFVLLIGASFALAETIPPVPTRYFNDYTGLIPPHANHQMNEQLARFEKETTNQIVVAIYPTMDTDSSIEDYTNRIARSWKVGQKQRRNGIILFVFVKAPNGKTKIRIETGYGLEGALPDATAFGIIQNDIIPHIALAKKNNDQKEWTVAMQKGIDGIIAATKAEYKPETKQESSSVLWIMVFGILTLLVIGGAWAIILKMRKPEEETEEPFNPNNLRFNALPISSPPPLRKRKYSRYTPTPSAPEKPDDSISNIVTGAILGSALSSSNDDDDSSSSSSSSSSSKDDDSGISDSMFSSGGGDSFGGGGASGEV